MKTKYAFKASSVSGLGYVILRDNHATDKYASCFTKDLAKASTFDSIEDALMMLQTDIHARGIASAVCGKIGPIVLVKLEVGGYRDVGPLA